jgi:hypothetical protein
MNLRGVQEIRVRHLRPQEGSTTGLLYARHDFKRRGTRPDPKGGETFVFVMLPDGRSAAGKATCSNKDNFNRATGRRIALERALEDLREVCR